MGALLHRMRARLQDESGFALIGALLILIILMGIGIALVSRSDTQQNLSGGERLQESSFNLAEAALNAEALQLGRSWPGSSTSACGPSTSGTSYCPPAAQITNGYTTRDFASACPTSPSAQLWKTQVNDNAPAGGAATQYWTTSVNSWPTYDANGDGTVWVRSWSTVQCKTISIVGLVSSTSMPLSIPNTALSANYFSTSNQGKKVIIDTLGAYAQPPVNLSQAQAGKIVLRCNSAPTPCANYAANKGQVQPPTVQTNSGTSSTTLSAIQLQSLEQQASSSSCPSNPNGTCLWTSSCPTSPAAITSPSGPAPVVVQGPCNISITGNGAINSASAPGVLVVENGTLTLGGTAYFYGLIYMVNKQASSGNLVSIQGNATVQGSVLVDGAGGVTAGSSKTNLIYDQRATTLLRGSTGAAVNKGSIRVLPPSTP